MIGVCIGVYWNVCLRDVVVSGGLITYSHKGDLYLLPRWGAG